MKINDRHKGETIFLLGCGTSLTPKLAKRIIDSGLTTIGVNQIYRTLQPTYHLYTDYDEKFPAKQFSALARPALEILVNAGTKLFAPYTHQYEETTDLPHFPFYADHTVRFETVYKEGDLLKLGHSSTCIFEAIQIAAIMGAAKIVLVGVDFFTIEDNRGLHKMHNYSYFTKLHPRTLEDLEIRRRKFDHNLNNKALPILNKLNIPVLNASSDSKVTALPKININEVL